MYPTKAPLHTYLVDGKKTAAVNVFIDPENGFSRPGISEKNGGSLYVPAGEEVAKKMCEIIEESTNGIFVIAQDYHPRTHISFTVNHPGILEYRIEKYKKLLVENNQSIPGDDELREAAQQPVHFFNGYDHPPVMFPFEEIVLDQQGNIIGLKEADGRIREVNVITESGLTPTPQDRGRVSSMRDTYLEKTFDELRAAGALPRTQTIWTTHCVQGTESSLYPADMGLPKGLIAKLEGDLMSPSIHYRDPANGNQFYIIRKGMNSEIDSYGIGVENDGETLTPAWNVFGDIAAQLKSHGVEHVETNVGGLATNFCGEFSANHIADFLSGRFKMRGMESVVNFVPEISRAIPIAGGADVPFSADGALERMQRTRNIGTVTVDEIKRCQQPGVEITGTLKAQGNEQEQARV